LTKAVAYLTQLAESRKLRSFAKAYELSYVYLWQLKTPKTDSRGRALRDPKTGRVVYRRHPSFKIIDKLKDSIPTEYWYEEEATPRDESTQHVEKNESSVTESLRYLDDDPFCGVITAWSCDPELTQRSKRRASPPAKIILDLPF
jgi:hypothetical protein